MTSGSSQSGATVDVPIFEVERFEWTTEGRIELSGVWTGVRGRRFIRPTLVLHAGGRRHRLLALLEHKPWAADDDMDWIAAFAWDGDAAEVERVELSVASGVDLELPPPRRASGKKAPRRFRHRAVSHDATRDDQAAPVPAPAKGRAGTKAKPAAAKAGAKATAGTKPTAETKAGAAKPVEPKAEKPAVKKVPVVTPLETELDEALERAKAAEARAEELQKGLDAAIARRKAVSAELAEVKEQQEGAVRAGRASERDAATTMLAEGAELRASVERQRQMAYSARDSALEERDAAVEAREHALLERKQALADRKAAVREQEKAFAERDHAASERDRALADREMALQERDRAVGEREAARSERDGLVLAHERGLPVVPPQPRHVPTEPARSDFDIWVPRALAAGTLLFIVFIVAHLFAGL